MNKQIRLIPWDTKLFNKNIFEITCKKKQPTETIKKIDKECITLGAFMAFTKINGDDIKTIHSFEKVGFNYIEPQYKIAITLNKKYDLPHHTHFYLKKIDKSDQKFIKEISKIAKTTFETDRYYIDPKIDKSISGKRYKNWFISSIDDNSYETYAYCFKSNHAVASFIMVKKERTGINLALGGVAQKFKGLGIYFSMMVEYLNLCYEQGNKSVYGLLSGINLAVLNIYTNLDFKVINLKVVLRKIY